MTWDERYTIDTCPSTEEISDFVGNGCWNDLGHFLHETYDISPSVEYSRCSMNRGWNVKYKKGRKAVCTLYPEDGYFTCLVSIGSKDAPEAELLLSGCTPYVQELYKKTTLFNGGRWLMIDVKNPDVLEDVKTLIGVRMKKKKPEGL